MSRRAFATEGDNLTLAEYSADRDRGTHRSPLSPMRFAMRCFRLSLWSMDSRKSRRSHPTRRRCFDSSQAKHGRAVSSPASYLRQLRASRAAPRSEEHTSELQSPYDLVCRLLLEK